MADEQHAIDKEEEERIKQQILDCGGDAIEAISDYIARGFPLLAHVLILVDSQGNIVITGNMEHRHHADLFSALLSHFMPTKQ